MKKNAFKCTLVSLGYVEVSRLLLLLLLHPPSALEYIPFPHGVQL